jgi:PAB1-binding protein PBP1
MANNMQVTNAEASAMMDAMCAHLNSGTLVMYTGTQPTNANTALSANTVLVTLTFGATAFGASVNGVATANAITAGTAVAAGTATFARLFRSDGTTVVCDLSVGTSGSDVNLNTTTISVGLQVSISSMTFTHPLH